MARFASSSSVSATTASQRRVAEPGDGQVAGVAGIGGQAGDVGVVGVQLQAVDPLGDPVEDDEPPAQRVERVPEQLPRPPVAGDQQERLAQPGRPSG